MSVDTKILLGCAHCLTARVWDRLEHPEGCGYCSCHIGQYLKRTGRDQLWRVLERHPERWFVRLLTDSGWQTLRPPHYREAT